MGYASTFFRQSGSLISRNFLLKRRVKRQIIIEFVFPFCFVLVLGFIRLSLRSTEVQPVIPSFPPVPVDLLALRIGFNRTIMFASPDTEAVKSIMNAALGNMVASGLISVKLFPSAAASEDAYRADKTGVSLGIDFVDGTLFDPSYTIRSPFALTLNGATFAIDQRGCRDNTTLFVYAARSASATVCPSSYYITTGIAYMQVLIDTALIKRKSGNPAANLQQRVTAQIMPKATFQPPVAALQSIAAIWFVFTFFPFILFLMILLVGEKEKKIKEGMRMMGMKEGAYWLSWAVVYTVIILAICIILTILVGVMRILQNSNLVFFFLIIFLYGLTLITISFMLTPFFDRAQLAGAVGSMATIVFSFLYLAISLTRYSTELDGPVSTIPSYAQWLLGLLSPVALALAIDQMFFFDIYRGGLNMSTITKGQFSVQAGLIMLAIDVVLYCLLGLYFDNVIPTEYGPRQGACFCFMPSYWRGSKRSSHNDSNETEATGENIESVPADMNDKKVISIRNVTKQFIVNGKTVTAVNGISLDIYEGQITALLGHNGAGKTTLISMLTGLIGPSSGTANIYNLDIRNPNDMSELRSTFGVCPQHDILFDLLSPNEHLTFFASLKGVQKKDIANEVTTVLANCDLSLQRDTPAEKLSGGQKRKLSVAIALIGAPKIVVLDEPTAGMDPVSRRHLWNVLKKSREGRVIILTTHFMDEADILADRKAMVSKGKIKCVGSSLFLKNRFGLGYHLGLETTHDAVAADVTSVVRSHIPNASPARVHGNEMTFTLPLDNVGQFPGLFKTLENLTANTSKGIAGFGIAMTTLEEVFLQIGEEEVEDEDGEPKQYDNGPMEAVELEPAKMEKNGHPLSAESYENLFKQGNMENLENRRFQALIKVRLLLMGRSIKAIFCRLILPLLFTAGGALVQKYVTVNASSISSTAINLSTTLYSRVTGRSDKQPEFYMGDVSDVDWNSFRNKLTSSGIVTEDLPSNITYVLDDAPHYVGINPSKIDLQSLVNYTALYNDSAYMSLPVIINTASNTLLNLLAPSSLPINVTSLMWPSMEAGASAIGGALTTALLLGLAIDIIPPFFAVAVVKDREAKARSQLRIAGISGRMYWGTTYLIDFVQFFVVCCLLLVILVAVGGTEAVNGPTALCYMLLFIIFVPNLLTFVYLLSFAFKTADNAQTVLTSGFILCSLLPFLVVSVLTQSVSASSATAFHQFLIFVDPPYGVMGLLFFMQNVSAVTVPFEKGRNATVELSDYFAWKSLVPITYISGVIHLILFLVLLYIVETAQTGNGPVGWCTMSRRGRERRRALPMDMQMTEDSDVAAERKMIEQITIGGRTPGEQMPVVCVRGLYKEFEKYVDSKCCGCNCSAPLVKVAVSNNSFTVNAGEVFGLLGPNGAGKTTTMNMIIAEETPTDGDILLLGQNLHQHTESALSSLGYCPQHNPLWDELTLQEHLEIYAIIRGVPKANIPAAVNYFLDALKLTEHAKKYSMNLSGGTKRKLCYCISLLGAPRIVLLDEPSTGMDPKSKRFLWDTISATFRSDKRGAILTTHYMEEANALCSRIGIMINGTMECLGSAQHLKNKYGSGYALEVKLAPAAQNTGESRHEKLNAYINSVVPGVQAIEVFGDRITYAVPTGTKTTLSEIFTKLEQGKAVVGIEEYSFSQSTLEQVFLSFAKKQLSEEEQAARDRLAVNSGRENSGYDDVAV